MSWLFRIFGGSNSAGVANVDANFSLQATGPITEVQAGFATMSSEVDAGTVTGARLVRGPEVGADYRLRVGADMLLFNEQFTGASLNTTLWNQAITTMAIALSNGFVVLNSANSVASAAVARLQTYKFFPSIATFPLYIQYTVQFPFAPVAGNVCEWGNGLASGTSAPTDGVFFRINAAGELRGIMNFGGTETQTSALNFATLIGANTTVTTVIEVNEEDVLFWINDVLVGEIEVPVGQGAATSAQNLPTLARCYNSSATGSAQQLKIGQVNITLGECNTLKAWREVRVLGGGHCSQGQTGQTLGTTANYANSANPTAAVPTNTTAALATGFGGQFWETDTLAVTTDGIVQSYQNPVGTNTALGKNLLITSVQIDSMIQTTLTGGGYTAAWSLAYGSTNVSLATAEGSGTKAPRRVPLGFQAVASGAAAPAILTSVTKVFDPPICIYPGEFLQCVKKKIGTAPTAGVVAHSITFNGYFE